MTATATVALKRDRREQTIGGDYGNDVDLLEHVSYAIDTTSDALRNAASQVLSARAVVWANRFAGAQIEQFKKRPANVYQGLFSSNVRDIVLVDEFRLVSQRLGKTEQAQLAIAFVPFLGSETPWLFDVVDVVLELTQLETNWNSLGGVPLKHHEAVRGIKLLSQLQEVIVEKPYVYPSPNGGVVIEFDLRQGIFTIVLEGDVGLVSPPGEAPSTFDLSSSDSWTQLVERIRNRLGVA